MERIIQLLIKVKLIIPQIGQIAINSIRRLKSILNPFLLKLKSSLIFIKIFLKNGIFLLEDSSNKLNYLRYWFKRQFKPKDFLSVIESDTFPSIERKFQILPKSRFNTFLLIIVLSSYCFLNDSILKHFLLTNFQINIDGIGSLGSLGSSSWQVFATVVSVGLATIGIILQALSQETNHYRRKLLLHHFFSKQELDLIILYSSFAILLTGLILLFKEKLFIYPIVSDKIFFVFILIIIFTLLFTKLIITSFNYLFPEKQNIYFNEALSKRLNWLLGEYAKGIMLIDYLNQQLESFGFDIEYIYEEKDKKNPNIGIIETRQKGSIKDIDIALLKKVSAELSEKYIGQTLTSKKPVKAKIYIEFGRPEIRDIQPLVKIHKDNFLPKNINRIKRAIILSDKPVPPIEQELSEHNEWIWDNIVDQLAKENIALEKDKQRILYDYYSEALRIFKYYKEKYKVLDNSTLDKPPILDTQLRKQFYVTLDSAYFQKKAIDPLFSLNYIPFALMHIALDFKNINQFSLMSAMPIWVYKKIQTLDHPRKKDLKSNFFLSNLNFAEFYILGGSENFDENFKKNKIFMEVYLKIQINLIKEALSLNDKECISDIYGTIQQLIKQAGYSDRRNFSGDLNESEKKPSDYIDSLWKALSLGILSWAIMGFQKGNLNRGIVQHLFNIVNWNDLISVTESFNLVMDREIDGLMRWDWWELEEKSFLDRGGSFGGFREAICKTFALKAIQIVTDINTERILEQKRLIKDSDTYFKLIISENESVFNFLNSIYEDGEKYLYLYGEKINNQSILKENIDKLKHYLKLTKKENEDVHKRRIIEASLDQSKVNKFREKFLEGYSSSSRLRKFLVDKEKVEVNIEHIHKPFYGIHTFLDKEALVSISDISYETVASHYGEQLASMEDYLIGKKMLDNSDLSGIKLYNASNLIEKLDSYIQLIPSEEKENTIIYVIGSFSVEDRITSSKDFEWDRVETRIFTGKYRGIKVFVTSLGEEKGVVVFNLMKSIKVKQNKPSVEKGEMISEQNHISFLIESFSEDEIEKIQRHDIEKGKKEISKERFLTNVRFWSYVCIEVELIDTASIYKIVIQTDESSSSE